MYKRQSLEYKFSGEHLAGAPGWSIKNSGIMLHSQEPSSMLLDQNFPVSAEVQLLGGLGSGNRSTANICTPGTDVDINSETTKQKNITVLRKGKLITLQIFPQLREFQNSSGEIDKKISIGVSSALAFTPMKENINLYEALFFGFERTFLVISQSISQLSKIIIGEIGIKNLQGPIGIAHVSSDIAKSDISFFIPLIAIISTSIGFLNLLPIPILDGGHLLMFAYEGITRRKPNQKIINYSATLAISALLTLMLFVSINDISRLILFWQ